MYTDSEKALHLKIRDTYVKERRAFESRLSGVQSSYGIGHMPKWDGTDDSKAGSTRRAVVDRYGKSYKPIWPKIAEFASKNNVDPIALVKNRFLKVRGPRPPEPTECMCSAALRDCLEEALSVSELNLKLSEYQEIFRQHAEERAAYISKYLWSPERVIDSVVRDLTLPFSPLYRVYLASVNGIDDVFTNFKQAAMLEYLRDRKAYSESLWASVIPKELADEAALTSS